MLDPVTFGQAISQKRKELGMSQKELAAKIKREDGEPISPQYLNDIEHDRRSPSSDLMVQQFAKVLDLNSDYLYYLAGRIPTDILSKNLPPEKVEKLMVAFRRQIKS
ncbi:XRE family transcriptional regulator [Sulfurifustis variabilis]|jgi:transcriptional regulator with XRE-family HTH domain|uniref:XRE family transcriptional regulator n=1 Tax=Sulfurifustis variabilis TaxID=1675686 RepID=A0A1B4V7X0_9GAMM|nr:helix-turn-helix transcriptional regulator [Sulfurifustis variabilis]BAU49629.1 XRE family transcriptional regulator [Sulfurifustis variabilis]